MSTNTTPSTESTDPTESDEIVAMTEAELYELCTEIAEASYHAASYRGQFRPNVTDLEKRMIQHNLGNWWEMNRGEFL